MEASQNKFYILEKAKNLQKPSFITVAVQLAWNVQFNAKMSIYLYTGEGAGKTTNALGLALRSLGHKHKVIIIQFLKW